MSSDGEHKSGNVRCLSAVAVALWFHHPRRSTFNMIIHHMTVRASVGFESNPS